MTLVYLDYAASAPLRKASLKAMTKAYSACGNPSSANLSGMITKGILEDARDKIAMIANCKPNEIIFTGCATESNNLVLSQLSAGDHLIISSIEHPSIIECAKNLEDNGIELTILPVDKFGVVSIKALEKAFRNNTKLVSIMHANNETGILQPVDKISEICKARQVLFHTDAAQAFCKEKISEADFITISSHKIGGPKGISALIAKKDVRPMLFGGLQENRKRAGTQAYELAAGFAAATIEANKKKDSLQPMLEKRLAKINGIIIHDKSPRVNHITSISIKGVNGLDLVNHLSSLNISISSGSACSGESQEGSAVISAMGFPELSRSTIRISTGHQTTKKDIDKLVDALDRIIPALRSLNDNHQIR